MHNSLLYLIKSWQTLLRTRERQSKNVIARESDCITLREREREFADALCHRLINENLCSIKPDSAVNARLKAGHTVQRVERAQWCN